MNLDERKLAVRHFYELFCEANAETSLYETVVHNKCPDVCPIYQKIARLKLLAISVSSGFDCIEIERIQQNIPQTVTDAFDRHFWYSQWTLSELSLVKIPIAEQDTFFLFVVGLCDDGWENNARFIEIFAQKGEFLGATDLYCDRAVKWREKQFTNQDYRDIRGEPPPPWSGDIPNDLSYREPLSSEEILDENLSCLSLETLYYHEPLWSEEMLWQSAIKIENEGAVIRYVLPAQTYGI
ncbi:MULTISPECIES: hypothetical protein [unclassified Microcoleus]|uniref:hypothetical protein n=1 Tax=unclassified Microcoleus TaxID=2642155 RepID=UPI002FD15511